MQENENRLNAQTQIDLIWQIMKYNQDIKMLVHFKNFFILFFAVNSLQQCTSAANVKGSNKISNNTSNKICLFFYLEV